MTRWMKLGMNKGYFKITQCVFSRRRKITKKISKELLTFFRYVRVKYKSWRWSYYCRMRYPFLSKNTTKSGNLYGHGRLTIKVCYYFKTPGIWTECFWQWRISARNGCHICWLLNKNTSKCLNCFRKTVEKKSRFLRSEEDQVSFISS